MKYLTSILLTGFILTGLFTYQATAQILEIRQTVYGMDCAPCAHGLEQRISKMEGVEAVAVSLNKELLEAKFIPENRLTLIKIRKSVEESGFQPKEAEMKIAGIIQKEGDSFILETNTGEKFVLTATDDAQIDQWTDELPQQVIVTGKTGAEKAEIIRLMAQVIENVEQ